MAYELFTWATEKLDSIDRSTADYVENWYSGHNPSRFNSPLPSSLNYLHDKNEDDTSQIDVEATSLSKLSSAIYSSSQYGRIPTSKHTPVHMNSNSSSQNSSLALIEQEQLSSNITTSKNNDNTQNSVELRNVISTLTQRLSRKQEEIENLLLDRQTLKLELDKERRRIKELTNEIGQETQVPIVSRIDLFGAKIARSVSRSSQGVRILFVVYLAGLHLLVIFVLFHFVNHCNS